MHQQIQAFGSIREELHRLINQSEKGNSDLTKSVDLNARVPQLSSKTYPEVIEALSRKAEDFDANNLYSIDGEIEQMRSELKKSCQLFQAAGEAFESINFNCLKHRIRDLHLSASHSEMNSVMQEKDVDQSLNKLTDIMGQKFRQHPGEFGDIPELSSFFKACSQLQHGLEELKRQRCQMDELGKRIKCATNVSRQRVEEIQKTVKKENK